MTSEFCLQLCESALAEFPYLFGDCQALPKTPEKTEMVPELCKRPHKQVLYKVLQFGDRRLVRQRRIEREDQIGQYRFCACRKGSHQRAGNDKQMYCQLPRPAWLLPQAQMSHKAALCTAAFPDSAAFQRLFHGQQGKQRFS